jgi:hypothetical protein
MPAIDVFLLNHSMTFLPVRPPQLAAHFISNHRWDVVIVPLPRLLRRRISSVCEGNAVVYRSEQSYARSPVCRREREEVKSWPAPNGRATWPGGAGSALSIKWTRFYAVSLVQLPRRIASYWFRGGRFLGIAAARLNDRRGS